MKNKTAGDYRNRQLKTGVFNRLFYNDRNLWGADNSVNCWVGRHTGKELKKL